jgi:hypothetical protein
MLISTSSVKKVDLSKVNNRKKPGRLVFQIKNFDNSTFLTNEVEISI